MANNLIRYSYIFLLIFAGYQGYHAWIDMQAEYESLVGEAESVRKILLKKKKRLKQLDDYFSKVEEKQAGIELVLKSIDKLQRLLPNENDDLKNKQMLKGMAEKVNLQDIQMKSNDPVEKDFYFLSTYELKGRGTYLQFLLFLEMVSKTKRLLNVSYVNFSMPKIKQKGRYVIIAGNIIIESYRYNGKNDEGASVQDIRKRFEMLKDQRKTKGKKKRKKKPKGRLDGTLDDE